MRILLAAALLCVSSVASAQDEAPPKTWDEYQGAHTLSCVGPPDSLPAPEIREHAGHTYTFQGHTAVVRRQSAAVEMGGGIKLGVLSGIKDFDPETRAVLETFLERFRSEHVSGLIIGGDSAEYEADMEELFAWLAATDLPVYVIIGNWESRTKFNRALRVVSKTRPNIINMNLVRRLDAPGFDIVSLGGYRDRNYVKTSGACVYSEQDAKALAALAEDKGDPVLLLMHGPPLQKGKQAIDVVPDAGNVGDPEVAAAIASAKIPFGIHGHILEAGGKAVDAAGKPLAQKRFHKALFLNPGPANPLPWKMNDGSTSRGLAALLTIKGREAKYEILRAPKR